MNNELNSATQPQVAMPSELLFRSRVADLLHLMPFNWEFAECDRTTGESALADVRRMLAAAPPSPQPVAESVKPIAWLRFWSACRAPDDCEDFYEVCQEGEKGIDGSPAFPVFATPAAALQPVAEGVSVSADQRDLFEQACYEHYIDRHAAGVTADSDAPAGTLEQLMWRDDRGEYGVLMFSAAWWAWQKRGGQ